MDLLIPLIAALFVIIAAVVAARVALHHLPSRVAERELARAIHDALKRQERSQV